VVSDTLAHDLPAGIVQRTTAERVGIGAPLHAPSSPRRVRAPRQRLGNGAAFAAGVAEEGGEH
jgi:hypothetical protein